jgi:hypothetical protein
MGQKVLYNNNGRSDTIALQASSVDLGNVTNDAQIKGITSSTDNTVVRWDATTGKLVQDSTVTIDDSGNIVTNGSITAFNVIESSNLVYENILETSITTAEDILITDLDLNTDKEYIVQIIASNTSVSNGAIYCYFNGDKTTSNYAGFGNSFAKTGLVWSGDTTSIQIGYLGASGTLNSQVRVVRNAINGYLNHDARYFDNRNGTRYYELNYGEYKVNVENLTSITLTVTYMLAGSIIRVFRGINRSADLITVTDLIEAKGDLLIGTSSNAIARKQIGDTDGKVLAVKASEADGTEWKALVKADVGLGNVTDDAQLKVSDLVTTIADPGLDTKVPSEQAVREAITSAVSGSSVPSWYHPFLWIGE